MVTEEEKKKKESAWQPFAEQQLCVFIISGKKKNSSIPHFPRSLQAV